MASAATKYIATLQQALDAKEARLRQAGLEITSLQAQLDAANERLAIPKVGDGTPDAALAIGKDAFRAGWEACYAKAIPSGQPNEMASEREAAWSEYEPPEHIKELS